MKSIFKIGAIMGISGVLFTACLKDTAITDYTDTGIKPVVLIPNGNFPGTAEAPLVTFEVSSTPSEIRLYARVSWSKPLGKALEVTFVKDPAAITEFNTKYGTSYAELNADAYSVPTYKVTIPADKNEAYIPIQIFTDKVSLSQANMLAFSITDASGEPVATNFETIVFPIGVKNKYDGVYSGRINATGWAAYGIQDNQTFSIPGKGLGLVTAGAASVSFVSYANANTTLLPGFTNVGGFTAFGAVTPRLTFDPATNKLSSVVNTTPDDGRGRTLFLNPSVTDSRYDPATKKIYASYVLTQTGRPNMIIYDTLTWVSAR